MAEATIAAPDEVPPDAHLERSTYEIIHKRLEGHADDLRERLHQLNQARRQVFGSIETQLLATERITTDNNCVPQDMVAISDRTLLGYNVHIGLRSETHLGDVFAAYSFSDNTFRQQPLDLLADDRFETDFKQLYRFYKQTTFARFFVANPHLYLVFQVGRQATDIKAFKWLMSGGRLTYLDNRSDHEVRYPPQHQFEWTRTHRDLHRHGQHPHVSIQDRLFVETVGGDLTIKIEDNTDEGEGIYSEPVDDPDQILDDAEIFFSIINHLILLKIRPYQESQYRYLVYNEKLHQVRRLDGIQHACVLLPDGHGLIFGNGYYLQNGQCKTFESDADDLLFERCIRSPNGEDYLYLFFSRGQGPHVLLSYNVISREVNTPLYCQGYSLFDNGQLVLFRGTQEPQRHHALQIWQTPYLANDLLTHADQTSYLFKIGNRDLVRGMSECQEILNLINREDVYAGQYVDLVKKTGDLLDSYYWLDHEDSFQPGQVLRQIRDAAAAAVSEYDKVVRVRQETRTRFQEEHGKVDRLIRDISSRRFEHVDAYVQALAQLRRIRGEILTLRELRYADLAEADQMEAVVATHSEHLARHCVEFLLRDDSLAPYQQRLDQQRAQLEQLHKASEARALEQELAQSSAELEMLIEIVSNLPIEDATQRIQIVDAISALYAQLNQTRATLKRRNQDLLRVEGAAEFSSQLQLLSQAVANYLDVCDTPQRCDEYLSRLMVQVEELEGRFAEFDEFVVQFSEKRAEIYTAFDSRRVALVEARNRRAAALMSAAERVLKSIETRVRGLESIDDIHSYFAADLMIHKVRDTVQQLTELGDSVKADDLEMRLKTVREDAVRQLKDRQELYVDGQDVIQLGRHRFSVNTQELDLTTIVKDDRLWIHLTGTNFLQPLEDERLAQLQDTWRQEVVSENRQVYRGEYLAYLYFQSLINDGRHDSVTRILEPNEHGLLDQLHQFAAPRYEEGYVKGVHDHDAAKIVRALFEMHVSLGLLHCPPAARALTAVFWHQLPEPDRQRLLTKLRSVGLAGRLLTSSNSNGKTTYVDELRQRLDEFSERSGLFDVALSAAAADYLFAELAGDMRWCVAHRSADICRSLRTFLEHRHQLEDLQAAGEALKDNVAEAYQLWRHWVTSFVEEHSPDDGEFIDEAAAILLDDSLSSRHVVAAEPQREITGLLGNHPSLQEHSYLLHYHRFLDKLSKFHRDQVPRFQRFQLLKRQLVDQHRDQLRLDEFKPRVLTSFVRNRLINDVYLPLLGNNLAKQIGAVGNEKRTDLMGLLLLISPPGYGKTTLMEYLANRLGITFVKINGPAIGHQVTSLDPDEAPNASAREEIRRLNLALEMGDNVMIYLDDIQHCHTELLQKFISLCDAQRKIEGVFQGRPRTYDLRGRRVAVVMAGNPYTESGQRFQVPDMLANRADTYNLGDAIGDNQSLFELSYLENSLTSNPTLSKLSSRSQQDVYAIIQMAERDSSEGIELQANYSVDELNELVVVMRKLIRVREVLLRVNSQYIASAAQADAYRTEPPFKLQGSYRDMNKLAERVVPVMNDAELETLILSHYENQAQTLTSDAEANLLKLQEMQGKLTPDEAARWADIRRRFQQNQLLGGVGQDDHVGRAIAQMATLTEGLHGIHQTLADGVRQAAEHQLATDQRDGSLNEDLRHVARQLETLGPAMESVRQSLVDGLAELTQRPAAHASASTDQPRPTEVRVINRIPDIFLEVVRTQFRVLESWVPPLLQAGSTGGLHQQIQDTLKRYEALIQKMEAGIQISPPDESASQGRKRK